MFSKDGHMKPFEAWPFFLFVTGSQFQCIENRKESDLWFVEILASVYCQDWGQSIGAISH